MPSPIGWRGLVTGASGGLGRYIAKALAASGVDLVLTGRDLVALNAVADTVREQGRTATVLVVDLSEQHAVTRLVSESNATAGPIDLLVNNAGVEVASAYTRYTETELSQIISLDLLIPLQLIRAVLPGMVARRRGHIVNICSLASLGPLPYGVPYAAAKAGLAAATRSLRVEYAGSGVGFSALVPGFVTGAGIYARHQAAGSTAPTIFGTVSAERVAQAVVQAVERNRSEVLVTGRPIRPALALARLAPRLMERLTGWVGVTATARQVARRHNRLTE
jgi:short-subunit dehydrogenase